MKTVSKTINVYSFSELSPQAQQRAIQHRQESEEWLGGDECLSSLKSFCERVGISLRNYQLGDRSNVKWSFDADSQFDWDRYHDATHMKGVRLWKWFQNNHWTFSAEEIREAAKGSCPLTGVWSDCPLFDAFARFLDKPDRRTTFEDLLQEAKSDFESVCDKEYEYCFSEEAARESLENSDDEFTEDGEVFLG